MIGIGIKKSLVTSITLALGLSTALGLMSTANAAPTTAAPVAQPFEAKIRAALLKNLGSQEAKNLGAITPTPIKGLYQVIFNGSDIAYVDPDANFLIQGNIFDLKNRKNITEQEIERLTKVDFKQLPIADAIVTKRGNGKRKIAVFEDPNCGYCKRFDAGISQLNNVTIYTFVYPILGSKSQEDAKAVWCAKDKSKTWFDWMENGKPLPAGPYNCDTSAIARNIKWGQEHKITGTPTIFFENGVKKSGAIPIELVEKYLNGGLS